MRWSSLAVSSLVVACGAPELQSQRLKDGSWSFQCELSMDECMRRVQENCPNQRFQILDGASETRLRDAPPFERAYHTSRLHLMCNDGGASILLSVDSKKGADANAEPAAKLCSVGQTRECVGTAACKGGQTCLPDGTGYGSCDCGPAPAVPVSATTDAPAEAVTSPAGAAATPPPASSATPAAAPTTTAPVR